MFHEALYWAAVTLTTVGYGESSYAAITDLGVVASSLVE